MLSCFGCGKSSLDEDREPLLPRYNDDTARQTRLHEKLHSYQMLRAISSGYMPSNDQVIAHLRSLLSADVLNPDSLELSSSGRALIRTISLSIKQFIDILQHKNSEDQVQDFLWHLTKARLQIDTSDISARASTARSKANAKATLQSLRTVGSLLLTNSDFRIFLADCSTIGKEVFQDTAQSIAKASQKAGKQVEPSQQDIKILHQGTDTEPRPAPSTDQLQEQAFNILGVVKDGAAEVVDDAKDSLVENVGDAEKETLAGRLKKAVMKLRNRPDYSESASVLSLLLRRFLSTYSHAASDTIQVVEEGVNFNPEANKVFSSIWKLISSFGSREAWGKVAESFNATVEAGQADPDFDKLVTKIADAVQDMLTDPGFFDNAEERLEELRVRSKELGRDSSISDNIQALVTNFQSAIKSVIDDEDIHQLTQTSKRLAKILSPTGEYMNGKLVTDAANVFVPLLIQAVQYFPIPRVEVSTPGIDLLVENLVLEPGQTVNHSSFLPYKMLISTQNDIEVRKGRFQTAASMTSLLNLKISGLSIAAEDLGYWLRIRSGLLRMTDEGLAGFYLDERGIDISFDIEIGRERLEEMITLRNVDVHIHHLNYNISKSKFACLAWLFKPLIRPIVKKALEIKIATGLTEGLRMLNRELVFARERLRATRIANPDDLWTFIKAVAARLTPPDDPDLDARVGVEPGAGVFRGRYAPGSLVKLWAIEAADAGQRVFEGDAGGWRNAIFDVKTRPINTWRG